VILKPSPENCQELYLNSLAFLGLDLGRHDVRFVEDDWESPTLGASGLGWEVWLDGMEITQFTYMQQMGGVELFPVSLEITYGLERIAMYLQGVESIFDILWNDTATYGDIHRLEEYQFCKYNFEQSDPDMLRELFNTFEKESNRLLGLRLIYPGYDACLKCSHIFNLLDARGALAHTQRVAYIGGYACLQNGPLKLIWSKSRGKILPDLLFELGVEEMPAKVIDPAIEKLRLSVIEGFARYGLKVGNGRSFGTPRRLGLLLTDVPEGTADRLERVFGPPARVAMENADALSPKGIAFVESQGPNVIRWFVESTKRGEALCVERRIPGTPLYDLAPKIFLEALAALSFPKVMRWGSSRETFVRPVRWILALLNEKILPIERYGLKSGGISYPHRYKGFAPVRIPHPQDYVSLMEEGFVSVFRRIARQIS